MREEPCHWLSLDGFTCDFRRRSRISLCDCTCKGAMYDREKGRCGYDYFKARTCTLYSENEKEALEKLTDISERISWLITELKKGVQEETVEKKV